MPFPLPENTDQIIGAVNTPLNLSALIILILSGLSLALFKNEPPWIKIVSFVLMAVSSIIIIFAFIPGMSSEPPIDKSGSSTPLETVTPIAPSDSESDSLANAKSLLKQADDFFFKGHNDEAREAYSQARTLYKAIEHRLGEANVLRGLGEPERTLGRNDQARVAYSQARTLFKLEQNRLGEAGVLYGIGHLERTLGRNDQAREAFFQAAHLYESVDQHDWKEDALKEGRAIKD